MPRRAVETPHKGRLWYIAVIDAVGYATFYNRSHDVVIRVYDAAGNVIETHEHKGDFKTFESAPQFPFERAYGF